MTLIRTLRLLGTAPVCMVVTLLVGLGGIPELAQAGESYLEFVGQLINNVQHISLDRFDPTCPQCL